jgi:hypothetical protein
LLTARTIEAMAADLYIAAIKYTSWMNWKRNVKRNLFSSSHLSFLLICSATLQKSIN